MSNLTFHKLNQLPAEFEPNSVYMVIKPNTEYFDLYVTSLDGNTIPKVTGSADGDDFIDPFLLMGV